MTRFKIRTLILISSVFLSAKVFSQLTPVNLRCEYFSNPAGVDVSRPALSWNIQTPASRRDMHQTAWQIIVAEEKQQLNEHANCCWNSGVIDSQHMSQILYNGKALQSGKRYWWKVRVWDETGQSSSWSQPAYWVMGQLNTSDWKAQWITAQGADKYAHQYQSATHDFNLRRDLPEFRAFAPKASEPNYSSLLARREFKSAHHLKKAILHISGLGQYELFINGKRVGDYLLAPGWSYYPKTVLYDTYNVTSLIRSGANAMALMLGNSMYNIQPDSVRYVKFLGTFGPLKAIVQLDMDYSDGSHQTIGSDRNWQVAPGPVTYSNFYGGEDYDARLLAKGWNLPRFKSASWQNAVECAGPGGELKGLSCASAPVKAIETLNPVRITRLNARTQVYDMGQNTSMIPDISIKGRPGASVRIIPAELTHPDGSVDRTSATQDGVRPAWWQYTLATNATEHWLPQFFYQGARYLQVELIPAPGDTVLPKILSLTAQVVHSSAEPIGQFSCSNTLFNQIHQLVRWAQRSNMMSILTDCPQREKQGWLEQYHLNGPSLRYNFNLLPNFRKGMNDMSDSQLENGLIPDIAPEFFVVTPDINSGFRNSTEWGSSFIIVPWQQYLFSGDTTLLSRYYERMKRYVAFLDASAKDGIIHSGLGDWYDIGPKPAWGSQLTPVAFTGTAIFFYDNQIMGKIAILLSKTNDARYYQTRAEEIRQAFNNTFFNREKGIYASGSNTTCAMPLFLNIAEPEWRKTLTDSLVADIRRRGNAFTSGEVGYRFLLGALAKEGHSDLIYAMNNQTDKPGYGYQIKKGATSLTEKWDAGVGSFGSQNHFMSGQINEWFFHDLLGIDTDPDAPGFSRSIINPMPVGDLKWVKGSYQTVSGRIAVDWQRTDSTFTLNVSIPANTSSTVYVPANSPNEVSEGSQIASAIPGITFLHMENGKALYKVGSGNYSFTSIIQQKQP